LLAREVVPRLALTRATLMGEGALLVKAALLEEEHDFGVFAVLST